MIKRIITFLFITFLSTSIFSQVSVSAHFSAVNFLGGSEVKNKGFGLIGNYGLDNGLVAYGGFGIYAAYELEGTFVATANSSQTSPSTIDVKYTNELPLTHIFVGLKKYFVGEYDDENFGIYGLGQIGFMSSKYTTMIDPYDNANYSLTVFEDDKVSNFMITLGAGLEKGVGPGYIFGEAKLNITSNEENGVAVEVELPASTELNIGYRYMF